MSGVVPQISLVLGQCGGIASAIAGMTDVTIMSKNGSLFVSPFIGWKEANGEDCRQYIRDIVDIYKNYGFYGKTQIICAAVRTPKQFVDCAVAGADIVTAGLAADGITTVDNICYIDRGYEALAEKLSALGAKIKRMD